MNCSINVDKIPDASEIAEARSDVCVVDWAKKVIDAAHHENCGKSVMCRDGITQVAAIIADIVSDKGQADDVARLMRLSRHEERYGLHFAEAVLSFPDYNDVEVTAKVVLDTLESEQPSLGSEQQRALWEGVNEDYADERNARKRYQKVREDPYYNALQIKYATAITGHKSQGGQWSCVFIDNPFWKELTLDDLKWLYTAVTRGVEKVFFINFKDDFFEKE